MGEALCTTQYLKHGRPSYLRFRGANFGRDELFLGTERSNVGEPNSNSGSGKFSEFPLVPGQFHCSIPTGVSDLTSSTYLVFNALFTPEPASSGDNCVLAKVIAEPCLAKSAPRDTLYFFRLALGRAASVKH